MHMGNDAVIQKSNTAQDVDPTYAMFMATEKELDELVKWEKNVYRKQYSFDQRYVEFQEKQKTGRFEGMITQKNPQKGRDILAQLASISGEKRM